MHLRSKGSKDLLHLTNEELATIERTHTRSRSSTVTTMAGETAEQVANLLARITRLEEERRNQERKPAIRQDDPPSRHYGLRSPIIEPPLERLDYEVKASMIHLVKQHQFNGLATENPMEHIESFETICSTTRSKGVPPTYNHCKLFQFSLAGKAERWFRSLAPNSLNGWGETRSAFIDYFFNKSKTAVLKQKISTFKQLNGESFNEAWERFKEYQRDCPHHGFPEQSLLSIFYDGVDRETKTTMNAASHGSFMTQSLEGAYLLIENLADSTASENKEYDRSHKVHSIDQNKIDQNKMEELINNRLARLLKEKGVRFCEPEVSDVYQLQVGEDQMTEDEQDVSYVNGRGFNPNYRNHPNLSYRNTNVENPQDQYYPPQGQQQRQGFQPRSPGFQPRQQATNVFQPRSQELAPAQATNNLQTRQQTFTPSAPFQPIQTTNASEYQDRIEKILEKLLLTHEKIDQKVDAMYTDINGKFEAISAHVKKLDTLVAQQTEEIARQQARAQHDSTAQCKTVRSPEDYMDKIESMLQELTTTQQEDIKRTDDLLAEKTAESSTPAIEEPPDDKKALLLKEEDKPPTIRTLTKKGDPGQFIVPCSINGVKFKYSFCDTGSGINLMSRAVADQLHVTNFLPSKMTLTLADSSTAVTAGKVDLDIRIGDCLVPTEFQVVETNDGFNTPLLLGRPFMATAGALIDLPRNRITFTNISRKVFYDAFSQPDSRKNAPNVQTSPLDAMPEKPPDEALSQPDSRKHASEVPTLKHCTLSLVKPFPTIPSSSNRTRTRQPPRSPKPHPPDARCFTPQPAAPHIRNSRRFARISIHVPEEFHCLAINAIREKLLATMDLFPEVRSWELKGDRMIASKQRQQSLHAQFSGIEGENPHP